VLTGGPGTGKTFATHIAVRLWRAMGRKVLMCAPTGRAAQRLAEIATAGRRMSQPVQSSTIHRLLETRRGKGGVSVSRGDDDDDVDGSGGDENDFSYKGTFARDSTSPLDADVVVVDESSMLDLPLCAALLDAVKPDAQLVFVGDADQLPSVGPGSVLRDVLLSRAVPAVQLRDVFRQAEQSGIVRAAHAINAGRMPEVPVRRWDANAFALVDDETLDDGDARETSARDAKSKSLEKKNGWSNLVRRGLRVDHAGGRLPRRVRGRARIVVRRVFAQTRGSRPGARRAGADAVPARAGVHVAAQRVSAGAAEPARARAPGDARGRRDFARGRPRAAAEKRLHQGGVQR
jgi:hypothetical protein